MNLSDLVSRLKAKRSGRGFMGICPAHQDGSPSLSISQGDKGVLLKCHAGCTTEAVCKALGIELKDLFFEAGTKKEKRDSWPTAKEAVEAIEKSLWRKYTLARDYSYELSDGTPVLHSLRFEDEKKGKTFRLVSMHGAEWKASDLKGLRPLYKLPSLSRSQRPVVIVEGEKCVEATELLGFIATTSAGGAQGSARTDWSPLKGRTCFIIPDCDEPGEAYAAAVKQQTGARVIRIPGLKPHEDIADLVSSEGVEKARNLIESLLAAPPKIEVTYEPPKDILAPGFHDDGSAMSVADFTRSILQGTSLYVRAGKLVEVVDGACREVESDRLRGIVHRRIKYVNQKGRELREEFGLLTKEQAQMVVKNAAGTDAAPEIETVNHVPIFGPQGQRYMAGYHKERKALVLPFEIAEPGKGRSPEELLVDFPMGAESVAAVIAAMLTLMFRPGCFFVAPAFVFTASQERVGKSKVVNEIIAGIIRGRPFPSDTWPKNPEEVHKRLSAALLGAFPVLLIDNVPSRIDNDALASFLTADRMGARILGESLYVDIRNALTIFMTGNAIQMSAEMAKRCVFSEILTRDSGPERRGGFKYEDLPKAVAEMRPYVLRYLCDIVERWVEAGCPPPSFRLGGFEAWRATVGGVMRDTMLLADYGSRVDQTSSTPDDLEDLIERWLRSGYQKARTTDMLNNFLSGWGSERFDPMVSIHARSIRLANYLRDALGRVVLGHRICKEPGPANSTYYYLEKNQTAKAG